MTLDQVLTDIAQRGLRPRRVSADSRRIGQGDVFVALPGARVDGRRYIAEAMVRGAVAIVAEAADLPELGAGETAHDGPRPPVYFVPGLASQCGALAAALLGEPSRQLWLAGVTGTNGKTSTTHWIAQALGLLDIPCAVIGTLGSGLPGAAQEARNTTPDALELQSSFADFVAQGVTTCAMEVSSIGIEQGRVNGVAFDVAVFTNLTRDHLDYHGDMAAYGAAKRRLFQWPELGAAVINADDAFGRQLLGELPPTVAAWAYALDAANLPPDDRIQPLLPRRIAMGGGGLSFELEGVEFRAPLVGRFNLSNLLAVIGTLRAKGHQLAEIAPVMACLQAPPGRMQSLGGCAAPLVVVDYAHTPDALEKVLATLRGTAQARGGRLICLFGCGGDRDPGKRPQMGRIAEEAADFVWVTSDNPRSEAPEAIVAQIVGGMRHAARRAVEVERGRAIAEAVQGAANEDVIVIAGKGHEPYQEIAGVRHPFSDLEVAKSALAGRHETERRDPC